MHMQAKKKKGTFISPEERGSDTLPNDYVVDYSRDKKDDLFSLSSREELS